MPNRGMPLLANYRYNYYAFNSNSRTDTNKFSLGKGGYFILAIMVISVVMEY